MSATKKPSYAERYLAAVRARHCLETALEAVAEARQLAADGSQAETDLVRIFDDLTRVRGRLRS